MNNKDFDPTKIKKIDINKVIPNDYNPKEHNTKEYREVVRSIKINGLKQPIFVRESEDSDKFIIVDGEQRYTAAKEVVYKEIYIYNLGHISEDEAKALTVWFEVQVPFNSVELAPIVIHLNKANIEVPYSDEEIIKFEEMLQFDFNNYNTEEPNFQEDDDLKTLNIKMTAEQFQVVDDAIQFLVKNENISEGRALELLCANGINGYPFNGENIIEVEQ